jgi:MFS family permease
VGTAVTAALAGRLGASRGYRPVIATGGAVWAAGTAAMALVLTDTPHAGRWIAAVAVAGLGSGLMWGSLFAVTLSSLPVPSLPAATGLNQTLQNLGNVFGVALVVTVLGEVAVGDRGRFPAVWVASAVAMVAAAAVGVRALGTGARIYAHTETGAS